ncbi:transposase family protein [Microtetraspora malaysiensis]|uniref:transposase family protein n=1 Tax=Microtetraspora malaysiensis TaxID=161358 RepID=UPI003D94FB98
MSDVRLGREHDITCARHHGVIAAIRPDLPTLADLGYEGAADVVRIPIKKKAGQLKLGHDQHTYNTLLRGLRGAGVWLSPSAAMEQGRYARCRSFPRVRGRLPDG